jgi:hypothetical protein
MPSTSRLTQLGPHAQPAGAYGSFANRPTVVTSPTRSGGTYTWQHPNAIPGMRYGSFAGRTLATGGAGTDVAHFRPTFRSGTRRR